jgi:hypothetical protein
LPTATKFLNCFRQAIAGPSRPVRQTATPNDQPGGPPKTDDDRKVHALREEIQQRFKDHVKKEKTQEVSSTSKSEMPKRKIQTKAMPKQQKGTAGTVDTAKASDPRSAASVEGSLTFETSRPTWVSVQDVVLKKQKTIHANQVNQSQSSATLPHTDKQHVSVFLVDVSLP